MAANTAPEKLKKWRTKAKLTLKAAGELVNATSTAWFDWERGDNVPEIHTAQDIETTTGGRVKVDDWAKISRARAQARRRAQRTQPALKTGTNG